MLIFLQDLWEWIRVCPVWAKIGHVRKIDTDTFDSFKGGTLSYSVTMAFIEGTTARDLLAASAATTAIWAARGREAEMFGDIDVREGRYEVATWMQVTLTPLGDKAAIPIFDGAKLVRLLERSQAQ